MPLNMNKQHEFKMKLLERGESILDFCKKNNFKYNRFNQSLNGFAPMSDEFQTAINQMLQSNSKE